MIKLPTFEYIRKFQVMTLTDEQEDYPTPETAARECWRQFYNELFPKYNSHPLAERLAEDLRAREDGYSGVDDDNYEYCPF